MTLVVPWTLSQIAISSNASFCKKGTNFTIVGCQPGLGLNEIVGCVVAPSSSKEHAMRFCHSRTMVLKRASSRTIDLVILLVALRQEG